MEEDKKSLGDVVAEATAKLEEPKDTQVESKEEPEEVSDGETNDEAGGDNGEVDETQEEVEEEETPPVTPDLPEDVAAYIDDKLQPVEVWGRDGDGGKVQKFSVKTAFDLPEDFVPRSYKDQQIQAQQFAKQDRLAAKLEDDYNQIQTDNAKAETQRQLEASWAVELKAAQAEGRIPAVKKEVAGDEGYKRAAEVIEYMKQQNDKLASIKAPYRIQSFTQALDLYEANQLKTSKQDQASQEEALTSKRGSMIGGGRTTKDNFSQIPKAGTKLDDILAEFA